jgi:D-alanine-D-alanine ligase
VKRLRVAVIMGGRSSEHDISLASARSVLESLDPNRYEVRPVEIGRNGQWEVGPPRGLAELGKGGERLPVPLNGSPQPFEGVDVVFPVLHGPFGEDGTVQGFLELAGVAYVGAGVTASALCMDKDLFKAVMRDKGIPVVDSITVLERNRDRAANPFGFPVVIKPARLGSSVGISVVKTPEEFSRALDLAFEHDEKVLIEEHCAGVEVECSVLGNEAPIASIPGEIVPLVSDWYDFSAKYDEGGMDLIVPPRLDDATIARVQELAVAAFVASDCEGMARVDFFVREDGEVVVNELNTIPGFTATSVYAKLFEASGISYGELLDRLVDLALERRGRRERLKY